MHLINARNTSEQPSNLKFVEQLNNCQLSKEFVPCSAVETGAREVGTNYRAPGGLQEGPGPHYAACIQTRPQNGEKRQLTSPCFSVLPHGTNSSPTGRIFMIFDISLFFENLSRKLKFHYNITRITATLRAEQCKFFIISQ